jgi:hypothetical protein
VDIDLPDVPIAQVDWLEDHLYDVAVDKGSFNLLHVLEVEGRVGGWALFDSPIVPCHRPIPIEDDDLLRGCVQIFLVDHPVR